jgi:hypothetical protein
MTGTSKKMVGWLWAGVFYVLVLVVGIALVSGGTLLATFGLGVIRNDATWHLIAGIALMVGGGAAFVGGVILLFRITDIPVPGRRDYDNARTGEYAGYTDSSIGTYGGHGHHHAGGGGHDGGGHGGSGGN